MFQVEMSLAQNVICLREVLVREGTIGMRPRLYFSVGQVSRVVSVLEICSTFDLFQL